MRTKKLTNLVLAVVCAAGFTTAKANTVVDKPIVMVTTVYKDGVTKDPNGNLLKLIDSKHRYIGVTIGCERTVYQFSGNCYITDGDGHYLTPQIMYADRDETKRDKKMIVFDEDAMGTEVEDYEYQHQYSKGTFFSTSDPTYKEEWTVTQVGNYYTIYSPYKQAYLATQTDDARMYITKDVNDGNIKWKINNNSQIYQDRKNNKTYFALHYEKGGKFFQVEDNANMLLASVVQSQIVPIKADVFKSTVVGSFDIDKIITAIKEKLAENNYKYAYTQNSGENICKGILYVDMTGLQEVTNTNDESWKTFQDEVAANCLFFVPQTYKSGCLSKNVVAKNGTGYIAKTDFELTDNTTDYDGDYVNPFFSPYTFDVMTPYNAIYNRGLGLSQVAESSTVLLPFGVHITNAMSSKHVVFYGEEYNESKDKSVKLQANHGIFSYAVGSNVNMTEANKPYHVKMSDNTSLVLDIQETNTTVVMTEVREYENNMGDWTAHGNYFGKLQPKSVTGGTQYYYYNNGMYLNSSFIGGPYIYADPYRVYFTSNDGQVNGKSYSVFFDGEEDTTTSIESATANETAAPEVIYTLSGVKVNGKPQQHGIYIVNGKKKMF